MTLTEETIAALAEHVENAALKRRARFNENRKARP